MIDQSDYYSYEFSAENLNEFINSEIFSEIEDVDDLSYTERFIHSQIMKITARKM